MGCRLGRRGRKLCQFINWLYLAQIECSMHHRTGLLLVMLIMICEPEAERSEMDNVVAATVPSPLTKRYFDLIV